MNTLRLAFALVIALCFGVAAPADAHPVPFSYVDVRLQPRVLDISVVAHVLDIAHELKIEVPESLLDAETLRSHGPAVTNLIASRLQIVLDGQRIGGAEWSAPDALPDRQAIRLRGRFAVPNEIGRLDLAVYMFPYDAQHKTFLNIYDGGTISAQAILDRNRTTFEHFAGTRQGIAAVVRKFVPAGIHHILIGPDHLLFLVGLLLLGGSLRQLLLVVTAFTIAHSLTLSLAALRMVIPPANAIEPAIALSVVYVGADNLLVGSGGRDTRPWIAFAFGLIHGFGFANVLREMDLPTRALGWTLFSFNIGVEIGQLVVVAVAASIFSKIRARSEVAGRRLAFAGSIVVMLAGAFWFVQRVFFSGGTA